MFAGAPANLPAGCHERRETAMPNEERESAIAMGLARRTYLYRLFHVVFGSRPTGEGVAKVLGDVYKRQCSSCSRRSRRQHAR